MSDVAANILLDKLQIDRDHAKVELLEYLDALITDANFAKAKLLDDQRVAVGLVDSAVAIAEAITKWNMTIDLLPLAQRLTKVAP